MLVLERLVFVARRVGTGTLERPRAKSQRGTNPPRLCFFRLYPSFPKGVST